MALRGWIDHLPLWIVLGAIVSSGLYEPGEMTIMALPLAMAAVMQMLRWDINRCHRWVEIGALIFFLGDLARGRGVFLVAIQTLFVLAGARLVLSRDLSHRRQLLLIGFLLFLTTAIGTTDLTFLVWTLAWSCAATLALLQQSWEPSAALRRGVQSPPPYAQVPVWVGAALVFGAGVFIIMPRLSLGFRPALLLGASRTFGQAGLGDRLDLSGGGPIEPNPEVAVRIAPPAGIDPTKDLQRIRGLELLRGITLESVHGQRWEPTELTPPIPLTADRKLGNRLAEFNYLPSPQGILALPAGLVRLDPSDSMIVPGAGASRRWRFLRARPGPPDPHLEPEAGRTQRGPPFGPPPGPPDPAGAWPRGGAPGEFPFRPRHPSHSSAREGPGNGPARVRVHPRQSLRPGCQSPRGLPRAHPGGPL